jgi:hypothetical protein
MAWRSVDNQRAYDAGYKRALLDALKVAGQKDGFDLHRKIGGPDSPFKPYGAHGSIYNVD